MDFEHRTFNVERRMPEPLADEALSLEENRTKLKREYFKKFSEVITPRKAVRFFQIENQLNAAIDLRIAATLPLIK